MYSFLINTLFSNEMTASDLLFGNFVKNIKDTAIPTFLPPHPHFSFYRYSSQRNFLAQSLFPEVLAICCMGCSH